MAEILSQTYTAQNGDLVYVWYNPDTGQYRYQDMSNGEGPGMYTPVDASTAPPLPNTPPTGGPDHAAVDGTTQQQVIYDETGTPVAIQNTMLDPVTGKIVQAPYPIPPIDGSGAAPVDDGSGTAAPLVDTSGGTTDSSGGYTDSSGYYHSGSGYSGGSSGGYSSHGGYSSGGGYSSSGSSGGYSGGGSSGAANLANARQMQNDWIAQHTQGGGGGSTQKDATVPGGAAAGGWGARSAPPVTSSHGSSGGSSGGGGGQIGSTIRSIRGNILSHLGGMFGGGSSSGYTHYPSSKPAKPPKPFQPPDPHMHGFAHAYDNLNAKASVFTHPEWLIPRAVGVPTTSGVYDGLKALPVGPLAQLMADSKTRGYDDTNKYINTAGRMYDQIANGPTWFDPGQLMNRLLHPKPGTQLGIQFGRGTPPLSPQDRYYKKQYGQGPGTAAQHGWMDPRLTYQPPGAGTQADQMMQYVHAINRVAYGSKTGAVADHWAQSQIDQWGSRNIHRKPGTGRTLPQYLRGRV